MRNIGAIATLTLTLGLALAACGGADTESGVQDATSMPYADGTPEAAAILAVANDKSLDLVAFDEEVGLHKTAAKNLIAYRDGDPETDADDHRFAELRDLWSISYCKTSCFESLLAYAKDHGLYGGNGNISVVFSPQQNPDEQHLAKIAKLIDDEADETIDIALYSYSHSGPIRDAIERALDRGVKIRFLADTDLANSASKGGALEEIGIDVRRVTKIMHHKFAIIDGPRDDDSLDRAMSAHVVSGSANWSSSAGSLYDENTLFMTGYPEIALRLQRDFDTLWAGSKDKVWQSFEWDQTRGNITDALIAQYDDPNTDVFLTSFNFKPTSSGGWSVLGTSVVTDELVKAIHTAETSIHVASGHFINLPVAQAILDVKTQRPDVEVDIILDCQEIPRDGEIVALKAAIEAAGGTIQYKCNTFRWHYKYAKQMHHKYIVLDGDELYTGSLNLSDNAETNTFENMMMLKGAEHQALVDQYLQNHAKVRSYGHADDDLTSLLEDIETATSVPLSWSEGISMTYGEFQGVRDAIRDRCPATKYWVQGELGADVYDSLYNAQPQWFQYCSTTGYPWPKVPCSNLPSADCAARNDCSMVGNSCQTN